MVNIFKDKKFLKEMSIILVVGIIVNALCFLMPLIVHAESPTNYYPVTSGQNNYSVLSLEQIFYKCNQIAEYDFTSVDYVIRVDDISTSSYPNARAYFVLVWDKALNENPFYIEVNSNTYFEFHKISNTTSTFAYRVYSFNDWKGDLSDTNINTVDYSSSLSYLNGYSPLYRQNVDYIFNVTINLNQPDNTIAPVLLYYDNPIDIGDFSDLPALDEILNDISNSWQPPGMTGHALPSSPTENPNNTPFQERKDFFDYIASTVTQNFGNLGTNLANWFNGLQQKLTNGFNSVSQNIWNGFATLMSNIKDFFGPKLDRIIELLGEIKDKTGYFTEDFNSEEVANYFEENCSLFAVIDNSQTFLTTLNSTFTNVVPPQRLTFSVDFSNGPWPFSEVGIVTFNFDWYERIRHTIVPWIMVFLYCGAVYSLIMQLPNIIHGTSGLFHPTLTESYTTNVIETGKNWSETTSHHVNSYSAFGGRINFDRSFSSVTYTSRNRRK